MKTEGWDLLILSDPAHEHLIAELYFDGQLLAQLDREEGRNAICVSLIASPHMPRRRIPLKEYLQAFKNAADDLAQ